MTVKIQLHAHRLYNYKEFKKTFRKFMHCNKLITLPIIFKPQ